MSQGQLNSLLNCPFGVFSRWFVFVFVCNSVSLSFDWSGQLKMICKNEMRDILKSFDWSGQLEIMCENFNERYIEEAGADHQIIIWRQKVAQLALSQISPDVATRSKTGKKIRHKPFINICMMLLFIICSSLPNVATKTSKKA